MKKNIKMRIAYISIYFLFLAVSFVLGYNPGEEIAFNFFTKKRQPVKLPENVRKIVCSNCVQRLLLATPEEKRKAHQIAKSKDMPDKAEALSLFTSEDFTNEPEANDSRSDLARKRSVRKIKPSNREKRT